MSACSSLGRDTVSMTRRYTRTVGGPSYRLSSLTRCSMTWLEPFQASQSSQRPPVAWQMNTDMRWNAPRSSHGPASNCAMWHMGLPQTAQRGHS